LSVGSLGIIRNGLADEGRKPKSQIILQEDKDNWVMLSYGEQLIYTFLDGRIEKLEERIKKLEAINENKDDIPYDWSKPPSIELLNAS